MSVIERALSALRAGNPLEAETLAANAVKNAARRFGETSPETASAEFDLAQVLIAMGDLSRSAEAMRRAAAAPPRDKAGERNRLTWLMNLGEVLQRLGKLDEAMAVLEQGLDARAAFYGKDTEGYAFGQEPLADALLSTGAVERAQALAESAFNTLWKAGNPRAMPVAALRGAIRFARHGDDVPLLEAYEALPPALKAELVTSVLDRAERDAPPVALGVLTELRERLEDDEAPPADGVPQVVAAISNVARAAGDAAARREALGWLVKHFDGAGDAKQAVNASLGLALAHDDEGAVDDAASTYRDALERAATTGDARLHAQVKRNEALFHSKHERPEAEPAFIEAVALATRCGDQELLGRALIAQGIFVQHAKRLPEARALLERALSLLPASHPDTLYARSHLDAIVRDESCGCGDMSQALSKALEEMVRPQLPDGLLGAIAIDSVEELKLRVDLSRAPTPEEAELLDRVIHQAVAQLRGRIRRSGLVGA